MEAEMREKESKVEDLRRKVEKEEEDLRRQREHVIQPMASGLGALVNEESHKYLEDLKNIREQETKKLLDLEQRELAL